MSSAKPIHDIDKSPRRWKRSKKDFLTLLPNDLKLKLVSFLTRSDTLCLASCSSSLKIDYLCDEVWKGFIRRISPSLLRLPMKVVSNWRDKLKVFLFKPVRKIDIKEVRLHLVLNVDGVVNCATLSNPWIYQDDQDVEWMRFCSAQDFESNIPWYRLEWGSLMLLLTYDGMTCVLLPESGLECRWSGSSYSFYLSSRSMVHVKIYFTHTGFFLTDVTGSSDEDVKPSDVMEDKTGVESVAFYLSRDCMRLNMDTLFSEQLLKWY